MQDKNVNHSCPASLMIENQLCFPLYACSREIVKKYNPFLKKIGLTYTQYIVMMVLWEYDRVSVKELGEKLYLDSGTLTPVLKSLESKGLISRNRSSEDERVLIVKLTESGDELKFRAEEIPGEMACSFKLTKEEAAELYRILYKILGTQ